MSMKRLICLLVTTLLLVALPLSLVCAASFTDLPTGWSAAAMTAAVENGLLTGYEDGTIRPETNLTRAQVATIITRAFGAQTTADISAFSDVPSDAWFAPYVSRAVKMGALNGTSATTMDPDLPITREQVFTAVGRILVLSSDNASVLNKFNDAGTISSWAVPYMSALVERGYINGDNFGNVNPKAYITREEFAQFMYNAIRTYITEPGTYNAPLEGITVIRVPGVTIQGVNATSDLVLGDGVGTGSIVLSKVTIEKRLLARGGTINLIATTTGDGVVVNNVNGNTHFNNYRTEAVFAGIIENTTATFLTPVTPPGGGGGGGGDVTTKHTVKFYLRDGDTTPYRTISNITNNTSLGSNLPTVAAEDIVGYEFEGWYHGTTQITASTNISGSWNIVAKLKRLDYPVVFKNEDGTAFSYFDGFTPAANANVETTYVLPTTGNIKRLGYTFNGWKDALGNPVTAITITQTTPASGFELFADFTKNTYYVEFYYEDQVTPVTFVSGYTAPHAYDVDHLPVLPTSDKVVVPAGRYFVHWTNVHGNHVSGLSVVHSMPNGNVVKLYAKTSAVPVTTYDLNFYLRAGDTTPYRTLTGVEEGENLGTNLPTVNAADIVGYTFDGWYNGTDLITGSTPIMGAWNPVAKLIRKDYPVVFMNEDGTAFSYFDGYTPEPTANVETTYVMPATSNIKRLGYTFNGWKDALGNPVTAINIAETTPDSGFELFADFTKDTYYVEFYYEDQVTPVTFIHGFAVPHAYDVDNIPSLPVAGYVVVPTGRYFVHWTDAVGNHISGLSVVESMSDGDITKLYAKTSAVPVTTYELKFYLRAGDTTPYRTLTGVEEGETLGTNLPTVNAADIVGYTFDGWYNGTDLITGSTPIMGAWNPVAKLIRKDYPVVFKNEDGTAFSYFDGYTPEPTANVETTYAMPATSNIKRLGYTFNGWKDAVGNPVTAINITETTPDSGFELFADFTKNTYYVEFYYEDQTTASFVIGYTVPHTYDVDNIPVLPSADKVVIPAGEYFVQWEDALGNPVAALVVTEEMANGHTLKLYAKTDVVPPTTYDLNFYLHEGDTTPYATISGVVSGNALGTSLPTVEADDIVGYNFRGWFNGTMPVTAYTPIIGDWDIVAKLELIEFPVFFKNEDGTPFSYFDGYTPAPTANFETAYVMPTASDVKRVGYTFNGWLDALGNPVSAITITASTPLTGIELFADFTKHTYYVEFYNEDGTPASFVSGYVAPSEYSVDSIPALPDDTKVVIPDSTRMFMYWMDATNIPVYTLTVTEDMQDGDVLKLYTYTELIPLESYTVSFYEGHGTSSYWMKNVTVTEQETVPEADIPDIGPRKVRGYKEDGTVASVYEGNEYTHITVPTYWYELNTYVCADCGHKHESSHAPEACANCSASAEKLAVSGKATLVPFDETIQILGDLKVYLLYQRFGLYMNYEETGLALAITAAYADDTRLMDTFKDLIVSGGNQLNTALMLDQIPKYDELTGKLKDRLVAAGLMDENKNLKLMYLPVGISTLVKENTANNMVKQYIRDVVNDPARLDSLLQMVDLATLINQMDTTELINTLSDQEIADIISDTENQEEVVNFIVTDLQSTTPKMLSMIVNFIQTNATFRDQMIDDLMAALMDKDDTSSLKSEALAHLRTLLNTDGSDLQNKFLNTVMDSLTGTDPDTDLQNTVIDEIQGSASLKGKFADMLITALKSDNADDPLKKLAISQIKTNPTVQGLIIDTLVGDLKGGTASDAVINHIRGSSELNDIIVTALKEKQPAMMQAMTDYFQNNLSSNPALLTTLTTTVQTTLPADTEDGRKLREAILMSGELESLLKDSEMKAKVVDMLLTVSFIDKVLADGTFRGDLLEAAIADEKFVDFLVNTSEFEGFVLPHLRVGGSLEPTITAMLQNTGTFVHEVLADLKGDDTFLGLVKEGGALRSEVLGEIQVGDYIVSEEDLLKYIFNQGGVTGDYSFIDSSDIEDIFRDEYEKRPESATKDFDSLTADERQDLLDELYVDATVRNEAITKINSHFDEYKEDILDEMVAKNNLSDPKVESLINDLLVDYIEGYIAEDATLNVAAKDAVEDILIAYVRELMTRGTIGDADLSDFKDDIIDLKTSFVADAGNLSTITTIIENFIVEEPSETRIVVNSVYDDLAHDLVTLVQTNSSVYVDVENKLKTVTVTESILKNFLVNNGGSTTVIDLMIDYFSDMATDAGTVPAKRTELDGYIAQCLSTMTNSSLSGHMVTFLATPANETLVRTRLNGYVSGLNETDLAAQLKILANDPIDSVTLKNNLITAIGTMDNGDIAAHLGTFISNYESDVRSLALDEVKVMTDAKIAGYLATFLGKNNDNYTMVETEVRKFLNDPAQEQSVVDAATKYLTNPDNESDIRDYLVEFLTSVDAAFVTENRSTIIEALDAIDLAEIVDAALVKKYIGRLDADGKIAFSNKVFNALKGSDDYKAFMYSLMNKETFEINSSNAGMIQAVSGAIRDLDYDFVMSLTDNAALQKIIDVMGDAFLRNYFDTMKNDYCDGLDEALERVKATAVAEEYTTSLTLQINPMELLSKLYEKAQPELVERLQNAGVRYDENIYLQYLAEHNVMAALFNGNGTLATGDYTGYQLKDVMDYYNYLVSLVMVADDAICWYGDPANVTESELDAVIDALFGKIYSAHEKLNEILETYEATGQLPSKAQDLVDRVKQINSLLTRFDGQIKSAISKYLNSSINDKLEDGNIHENEKVDRIIDLLIGTEEPTFNIDSLYALFYRFDDNVQEKLQALIDSGKLRAAIDKFESTDFGKIFKGNGRFGTVADKLEEIQNSGKVQSKFDSIYDLLVVTAEKGIEPYRVEKDNVTVVDAYEVNIAGVNLKIKRYYQ